MMNRKAERSPNAREILWILGRNERLGPGKNGKIKTPTLV
jgi:hypothetical protein